jgi:uroporphyrinogen decarboxylase
MLGMSHRERVLTALNHREPDRVPVDLGGTFATTLTIPSYERLKAHLGISSPTRAMSSRGRTAVLDEELLRSYEVDTRGLMLRSAMHVPDRVLPDGSYVDEWGVTWSRPEDGHFIDTDSPFRGPAPSLKDLEAFSWPDPDDPSRVSGLRDEARELHENTDYAVILNAPFWLVHQSQWLRGFDEWLVDLLLHPEFASALMDRVEDVLLKIIANALDACGEYVDIVFTADDLAHQNAPFMSLELYRKMIKPRQTRAMNLIKAKTKAKIVYHCCGSAYSLIPDLVDTGIDALNPVQVTARDMDPTVLKREFGDRLTFWGGIATQTVLSQGTTEEVREEVRRRIEEMAPGGGYVLASVHNIQDDVPPENVVAMLEAAREFGRYRAFR